MVLKFKDIDKTEFATFWETTPVPIIAQYYGVHYRTIQLWASTLGLTSRASGIRKDPAIAFPGNAGEEYDDFIKMEQDRVIIIGDCEIPDHDIEMFEHVVSAAKHLGIDTLIINGDFIANDSFSKWARVHAYRLMFKDELNLANMALRVFMQTFKQIIYLPGNHERRLPKAVEGEITIKDMLGDIEGIEISDYPYLHLTSGGEKIFVCHQKEYRRIPLSAPLALCSSRHVHTWCGHTHRQCFGWDPSGKYWLVEGGHCRSEPHTLYKRMEVTSHPKWNSGFGMVIDGFPYLIDRNNIDFWKTTKIDQASKAAKPKPKPKKAKKNG